MSVYQLGVIGCGNMAEALLRGVTRAGIIKAENVVASDPSPQRRELFEKELAVHAVEDNTVPASCPHVLLAVKPQVMGDVCRGIASTVRPDAVVISVAAGITTRFLDEHLDGRGMIVRVMPNTPMLAGEGISACCAGPRASDDHVEWVRRLFDVCGEALTLDEQHMDIVTAVSGSGPAYFCYLIEAMIAAARAEGLGPQTARQLAEQTCIGTARLLRETGEAPEVLRQRVTSPGGTTQRAIEVFDKARMKETIVAAIRAAAERSRELGKA